MCLLEMYAGRGEKQVVRRTLTRVHFSFLGSEWRWISTNPLAKQRLRI